MNVITDWEFYNQINFLGLDTEVVKKPFDIGLL
jgi:hypothetical protein